MKKILCFVDWDSTRRLPWLSTRARLAGVSGKDLGRLLDDVLNWLARCILSHYGRIRASVGLRVYHGWHRGNEETDDYRRLRSLPYRQLKASGRLRALHEGRIRYSLPPVLVDELAIQGESALLRATLRPNPNTGRAEQKMVDSAIVSDVLFFSRLNGERQTGLLVVGEDDDLLPAVIQARYWNSDAWVVRCRGAHRCMQHHGQFLIPGDTSG